MGILSEIKNLYPKYSTGKVKDFSAISGSYDGVPYGTENQRETRSGVFDASFFTYPKETTRELFERAVELIPSIPKAFGSGVFAGGSGFNVVLSEPQDEDWEFETILNTPGKVMIRNWKFGVRSSASEVRSSKIGFLSSGFEVRSSEVEVCAAK